MKFRSFLAAVAVVIVMIPAASSAQTRTRSLARAVTIAPAGREIGTNDSIRVIYTPSLDTTGMATGTGSANTMTTVSPVFAYTTARSVGASGWESDYQVSAWDQVGTTPALTMTRQGTNAWALSIPNIRTFYKVPAGVNLDAILFVFRNAAGNVQGKDIVIQLSGTATSVRNADVFSAASVYPNPSSQSSNISFSLKSAGSVTVRVMDARGTVVKSLVTNQFYNSGTINLIDWNLTNDSNAPVANGAYFYRIEANGGMEFGTIMVVR